MAFDGKRFRAVVLGLNCDPGFDTVEEAQKAASAIVFDGAFRTCLVVEVLCAVTQGIPLVQQTVKPGT